MHCTRSWSAALAPQPQQLWGQPGNVPQGSRAPLPPFSWWSFSSFAIYLVHSLLVCLVLVIISLAHLLMIFVNWLSPFNFSGSLSGLVLFFVSLFSIIFSFLYWELQMSLFLPSVRSTFLSCFSQNLHVFSRWLHPPDWQLPISQLLILPQSFLALSPWLPWLISASIRQPEILRLCGSHTFRCFSLLQ